MEAKRETRNRAAHVTGAIFNQRQAEMYISELFNNAVLTFTN